MSKKKMRKILIVEDDPMLSEIYQKKFSQANFEVSAAMSGSEAEEKAVKENPELMLLDLILPEEDGFDVLKKIKENPKTAPIKVVIFSNLSQEEDKEKANSLGADGFIAKSDFTPQQLVAEVSKFFSDDTAEASANNKGKSENNKILFVEDEDVFSEVFGKKLEDSGYKVEYAKNGAWALEKINSAPFDLIIMDILMPEIDGLQVIKQMRESGNNTPVIVISNSIEDNKIQEAVQLGANEAMIKSRITPSELLDKVKVYLGK